MMQAEIKSGPKMTWAVFSQAAGFASGSMFFNKRALLGKRAFFTFADAATAKIGRLRKAKKELDKLMLLPWHIAPGAEHSLHKVDTQLAAYEANGTVH